MVTRRNSGRGAPVQRMYYVCVQRLAESVLKYIRRNGLIQAGDRVGVAVSGGADSVALLRLMLELRKELGVVLSVVHFNHLLRGQESNTDERFVAALAIKHKLQLHRERGDVQEHASQKRLSVEASARELRYEYFVRLLKGNLNHIATAHTLDDQAETVLLRLVRGSGTRGLAGIYPQFSVLGSQFSAAGRQVPGTSDSAVCTHSASIIRPLLGVRRHELLSHLSALGQDWREDASNRDLRYARNRVRHGVLPRLERNFNPAVHEALAETAEIARAEEEYWRDKLARVWPQLWKAAADRVSDSKPQPKRSIMVRFLRGLPLALRRRVVRAGAESLGLRLEFRQVEEILRLTDTNSRASHKAVLPGGWRVVRKNDELYFECGTPEERSTAYEYRLPIPGRVQIAELSTCFETSLVSGAEHAGYNPEHLLNPALLAKELFVRNWHAGDRFWPAHRKAAKKIKELLQERHVEGRERKLWPVIVSGEEIIWLRGFPVPARFQPQTRTEPAVLIQEIATEPAGEE